VYGINVFKRVWDTHWYYVPSADENSNSFTRIQFRTVVVISVFLLSKSIFSSINNWLENVYTGVLQAEMKNLNRQTQLLIFYYYFSPVVLTHILCRPWWETLVVYVFRIRYISSGESFCYYRSTCQNSLWSTDRMRVRAYREKIKSIPNRFRRQPFNAQARLST